MELAINQLDGCIAGPWLVGPPVAAPIGGHEVESAIAIEIPGADAIPKATPRPQTGLGGGLDPTTPVIAEQTQGIPVTSQDEIGVAVAIGVGEDSTIGPDPLRHGLRFTPTLGPTGQKNGLGSLRVPTRMGPGSDKQVQQAIAIHVGHRHRAGGCCISQGMGAQDRLAGLDVPTQEPRCLGSSRLDVGQAGDDPGRLSASSMNEHTHRLRTFRGLQTCHQRSDFRHESARSVVAQGSEPTVLVGADEQIQIPVGIPIRPSQTRSLRAQTPRQEGLSIHLRRIGLPRDGVGISDETLEQRL